MESLVVIGILGAIAYWAFRMGKVTGSRGGFRAGLRRGRNSAGREK